MQERLGTILADQGYQQYEVSAYAQAGRACRHNRNYWEFGDYLGIGAGAHGKITGPDGILRLAKRKQPQDFLIHAGTSQGVAESRVLTREDAVFEFMLNALRLTDGVPATLFSERTGWPLQSAEPALTEAIERGWLEANRDLLRATAHGQRFLNDVISLFLPSQHLTETR